MKPYYVQDGASRKSKLVTVVRDPGDYSKDCKMPAHIVRKLFNQGMVSWDEFNNCYIFKS